MPPSTGMTAPFTKLLDGQAQVQCHVCHFLRVAVAAQGHAPLGVDLLRLVGDAGGHAGADGTRADAIDRDPVTTELDGEALREAHHAGLGGRVGGQTGSGDDGLGGRDVDHSPTTRRCLQVRQTEPDEARVGREVHVERARPVGLVVDLFLERRVDERQAGVVDQHVDTTDVGDDLRRPSASGRRGRRRRPRNRSQPPRRARHGSGRPLPVPASASRSTTATRAPSSANRHAVARPMPDAAPVTNTRRPSTDRDSDVRRLIRAATDPSRPCRTPSGTALARVAPP